LRGHSVTWLSAYSRASGEVSLHGQRVTFRLWVFHQGRMNTTTNLPVTKVEDAHTALLILLYRTNWDETWIHLSGMSTTF